MRMILSILWMLIALQLKAQEVLPKVATGKLERITNFKSKYVDPRKIEIFLPREYEKRRSEKFPVLYMHDGQNVFNASSAYGGVAWEADETARKMFKNVDVSVGL